MSLIDKWSDNFSGTQHPSRNAKKTSNTVNSHHSSERGRRSIFDDKNHINTPYGRHPDPELRAIGNQINKDVRDAGPGEPFTVADVNESTQQARRNRPMYRKVNALQKRIHSAESSAVHQSYRIGPNASNINDFHAKQTQMQSDVGTSKRSAL